HDITRIPNKDIPFLRRNIGIVFQDHRLLMDRSIYDNVALPMRIESISENEIKRRVSAALDKTGLLDKARCLPSQLSGGEQQR
ncbi:ATP-binding cassette domain-containing protein, partial [Vibrio alginolyticus]